MLQVFAYLFPETGTFESYLLRGTITFLIAAIMARLMTWLIWRIIISQSLIAHRNLSERRLATLYSLLGSLMNGLAVVVTIVVVLSMFVDSRGLLTALGLFSAGLGFGARPYVSDFLGGIVLLFEDQFVLGDKVEIGDRNVIGVVERVTLRTTYIRGDMGELWIVPNGDVRTIRNFTRGRFSPASIKLTIPTSKLSMTMAVLYDLIEHPGPHVVEQPEIISEDGTMGDATTLLLKVKAEHGCAPLVRRRLMTRLQDLLTECHIIET